MKFIVAFSAAVALAACVAAPAQAGAIRDPFRFTDSSISPNDDGSSDLVPLGFTIDFFGVSRDALYVNNNGNVTFDSSLSAFTPFNLLSTTRAIIAPFFADVDTRGRRQRRRRIRAGRDRRPQRVRRELDRCRLLPVGHRQAQQLPADHHRARRCRSRRLRLRVQLRQDRLGDRWNQRHQRLRRQFGTCRVVERINRGFRDPRLGRERRIPRWRSQRADQRLAELRRPGRYVFFVRNGMVEPAPVDVAEPGSLALLGAALAGAGFARRRKRRD
jgi:hypothetical protein